MMISPHSFGDSIKDKSYPEMIRERDRLIRFLKNFEKKEMAGDRSAPDWRCNPSPDVMYQVYLEYLAVLCGIMQEKYNNEYICTGRTLKKE